MHDTRKLLERCARVMGDEVVDLGKGAFIDGFVRMHGDCITHAWNPLTNLADAAELAIKCKVDVVWFHGYVKAVHENVNSFYTDFADHPTEQAAYCWTIVNVVAQMAEEEK